MDECLLAGMRRFLTTADIEAVYQEALQAKLGLLTEVTITSVSFEGGASSGQIKGDPSDLMELCELLLKEAEAEAGGAPVVQETGVVDFSGGFVGS